MEYNMNEVFPQQDIKLNLKIVERGVLFLFRRSNGGAGGLVQVPQSWSSIHSLLSRLRKNRRYCAKDVPLLIWKESDELHIKFHSPEDQVVEECVFSGAETKRILAKLERLPGLN
jgi:hypothetical protein